MSEDLNHIHWHKQVGDTPTHLYFECRCGSRTSGRRSGSRRTFAADTEWLDGANREPR